MCERFEKKRKEGLVRGHGSGYGGTGFKFDATEDAAQKAIKKVRGEGGRHAGRAVPCCAASRAAAAGAAGWGLAASRPRCAGRGMGAAVHNRGWNFGSTAAASHALQQ